MSILIESILQRKGGTKVTLDATTYHFVPDDAGRHVAAVSDESHIARFLQIREGFKIAAGGTVSAPVVAAGIAPAPTTAAQTEPAGAAPVEPDFGPAKPP